MPTRFIKNTIYFFIFYNLSCETDKTLKTHSGSANAPEHVSVSSKEDNFKKSELIQEKHKTNETAYLAPQDMYKLLGRDVDSVLKQYNSNKKSDKCTKKWTFYQHIIDIDKSPISDKDSDFKVSLYTYENKVKIISIDFKGRYRLSSRNMPSTFFDIAKYFGDFTIENCTNEYAGENAFAVNCGNFYASGFPYGAGYLLKKDIRSRLTETDGFTSKYIRKRYSLRSIDKLSDRDKKTIRPHNQLDYLKTVFDKRSFIKSDGYGRHNNASLLIYKNQDDAIQFLSMLSTLILKNKESSPSIYIEPIDKNDSHISNWSNNCVGNYFHYNIR